MQWEGWREGIDDVRYVTTLEAAIKRTEVSGSAVKKQVAAEARQYLETLDIDKDLDHIRQDMIGYIQKLN